MAAIEKRQNEALAKGLEEKDKEMQAPGSRKREAPEAPAEEENGG